MTLAGLATSTPRRRAGREPPVPNAPARVHHFGPDPAFVGGMGSVLRVLADGRVGGEAVSVHPTWRPNAPLASLPLAARAALAIPGLGRATVVHVHLAEDGSFVREGAIVVLARALRKTTVVTIHGADFVPFSHAHARLAAWVLGRAHLVTCLSREVRERVRELAPGTRVEMLPNPVHMPACSRTAADTGEMVLFAGEIGRRKGADVLANAWPRVRAARPRARCVMVGPVNGLTIAPTPGLELREPVEADAMRELLCAARVVALPSRAEGMPMILTEAMSHGRPFVSTPVGAIPELAEQGGRLVGVGDEVALARELIALLADRGQAASVGERGREFCRRTRSVEVVDARLGALYALAGERARR
jgi:glycosyltransferase involved in cell wall biosynthesis